VAAFLSAAERCATGRAALASPPKFPPLRGRNLGIAPATTGAAFVAGAAFLVDSGPGTPFGVVLQYPTILITLRNVIGLALLLVSERGFVASRNHALRLVVPKRKPVRVVPQAQFRSTLAPRLIEWQPAAFTWENWSLCL
jgi:hypothetical protein